MIQTKSVQKRKLKKDGIRILVMRRSKPEYQFDFWLPHLAPSEKLLSQYVIDKKIGWDQFERLFLKELKKNRQWLELVAHLDEKFDVTLLCWEETSSACHRSILLREIKKMHPSIDIQYD